MKLSELSIVKEETKGKWKIGNLKGVYKNFKSEDSADAKAWMRDRTSEADAANMIWDSRTGHWKEDPKASERQNKKDEKERAREEKEQEDWDNRFKPTDKDLKMLYDRGIEAIGSSFPDGDPIDHMLRYLDPKHWTTDEIDQAFKKFGHGYEKKGFYATVEGTWDDFSSDTIADAKMELSQGKKPDSNSPFFDIKDGKVVPKKNPWKN